MKRVWEGFIDDYKDKLDKYPTVVILEAFWNYGYDNSKGFGFINKRCDEVFERYDEVKL